MINLNDHLMFSLLGTLQEHGHVQFLILVLTFDLLETRTLNIVP